MRWALCFLWLSGTAAAQTAVSESVIDTEADFHYVSFTEDSGSVLAYRQGHVELWDTATKRRAMVVSFDGTDLANSPSGDLLATEEEGTLRVLNPTDGRVLLEHLLGTPKFRGAVSFSDDGRLAACGDDAAREVRVWDLETGRLLWAREAGLGYPAELEFSPRGRFLVGTYEDTNVYVWDARDGSLVRVIDALPVMTTSLEFSPDGSQLVTGGVDSLVRVWDVQDWSLDRQFEAKHPELILGMTLSADGSRLFTWGHDALGMANPAHLILWDVASGVELKRIRLSQGPVSAALSPDARTIAVVDRGKPGIRLWSVQD